MLLSRRTTAGSIVDQGYDGRSASVPFHADQSGVFQCCQTVVAGLAANAEERQRSIDHTNRARFLQPYKEPDRQRRGHGLAGKSSRRCQPIQRYGALQEPLTGNMVRGGRARLTVGGTSHERRVVMLNRSGVSIVD
jgi:hypothetical protein